MSDDSQLDTVTERPVVSVVSGCLYAVVVVVASGGMLFVNALFCLAIYSLVPKVGDEQIASRIGQMIFFVVPLAMLILEWHLIDRIQRLFRSEVSAN